MIIIIKCEMRVSSYSDFTQNNVPQMFSQWKMTKINNLQFFYFCIFRLALLKTANPRFWWTRHIFSSVLFNSFYSFFFSYYYFFILIPAPFPNFNADNFRNQVKLNFLLLVLKRVALFCCKFSILFFLRGSNFDLRFYFLWCWPSERLLMLLPWFFINR